MPKKKSYDIPIEVPQNLEAEEGLIACCLNDYTSYDFVGAMINTDDFYKSSHQILWGVIKDLSSKGCDFSEIEVLEQIRKSGDEDNVGGIAGIYAIQNKVETSSHVRVFAEMVKEYSKLRRTIKVCKTAIESAHKLENSGDIAANIDKGLLDLSVDESSFDLGDELAKAGKELTELNFKTSYPMGIPSYDRTLGATEGMVGGQVHIIGARPGRGKTTLALNVAGRTCKNKNSVGIFSLEMSRTELLSKMICMKSGLDFGRFKDKIQTKEEDAKYHSTMSELADWPIVIDDRAFMTAEMIKSTARIWKRKHGLNMIIIDYLQLIVGDQKLRREEQLTAISRTVKLLAKELDIPIILLAQLNRESEKENRAPRLTDLRESGSIEQDADIVTFLYILNEDKGPDGRSTTLRWNRPKQRNGPPDCFGQFYFNGKTGNIRDY